MLSTVQAHRPEGGRDVVEILIRQLHDREQLGGEQISPVFPSLNSKLSGGTPESSRTHDYQVKGAALTTRDG
jgi:hypothetical protein